MICELCNKETNRLESHHIIPRWFDDESNDIMELCTSCHSKVDKFFNTFILTGGKGSPKKWENPIKAKILRKKDRRNFHVTSSNLDKNLSMSIDFVSTKNVVREYIKFTCRKIKKGNKVFHLKSLTSILIEDKRQDSTEGRQTKIA